MFMRYAAARYNEKRRGDACRIYVSECLRMISQSTARAAMISGGEASYMERRLTDIIPPTGMSRRSGGELKPGDPTKRIKKLLSDRE